jgi:DNA polymerase-1
MGLPGGTKTKTGQWSTRPRRWRIWRRRRPELPRKIVDWRQLTKLKSTYTDALPGFINPRPSGCTPPIRWRRPRPGGCPRRSRTCRTFRSARRKAARSAPPSSPNRAKLISADYSQIELRVLAHVADIPQLKQAFADGIDIHAMTASEMFGVPVEGMPSEVRRRAKAINFGIIYGISAFGLANQLSIEREEAGDYIKTYFERFPGIKDYMDATKAEAKRERLCETIFGRRAHYPGDQVLQPAGARLQRARSDQRADPGLGRRHHPPRDDPHGGQRWKRRNRRACCCRCMTN